MDPDRYIRSFRDVSMDDVGEVGGKVASLGEMIRALGPHGIRVPGGFAITAGAYRTWLTTAGLEGRLRDTLSDLDARDLDGLARRGRCAREAILFTAPPSGLEAEIAAAYRALGDDVPVAVRSSATAEDLPEASFAGQLESFLNVRGERAVLSAYRACVASLFTDRAISYRAERGYDHLQVAISVGVQRMVRSDLACAGVLFTLDTETGFRDVVLVSSSWGLGESVVKGRVDPDEFLVHKPGLARGLRPILKRDVGAKQEKVVLSARARRPTRTVSVPRSQRVRLTLGDDEVLALARWGMAIERHYSERSGRDVPVDVEWAKDGETGEIFIVQARPETVHAPQPQRFFETFHLEERGTVLASGRAVGRRIGAGPAHVISGPKDLRNFRAGEVLVTEMTDPDWEPSMKMAAAIVTNRGGRTCHAAIVSRELGVPCVVGTGNATRALGRGQVVTVSCAEGESGKIYEGRLRVRREAVDPSLLAHPRTPVLLNVADPDSAFALSFVPNDGVGLVRIEFLVTASVGVHPLALTRFDAITDRSVRRKVEALTTRHPVKPDYFVEKLAEGVGHFAAAFWPKPVIVRFSDFKSNEYAGLLGGSQFEPPEANPMLGFRGASRYRDDRYRDGFLLECRAMRRVREEMGLENVKLMIPFCRTPEEGSLVLAVMEEAGLVRGRNGLEVLVMCEIPSNVLLAESFAKLFDGFSIGSNDLTQLTLGLDRDSALVAGLFDEENPAVLLLIASVIRRAHAAQRSVGICGEAPSDAPELVRFLVEHGIDSISVSPDRAVETMRAVSEAEERLRERETRLETGQPEAESW